MSLPNITKELKEVVDYFFLIAVQAYPGKDRGQLLLNANLLAEEWLIGQLGISVEEFRKEKNNQ
jgi:hypothetical protein